MAVEHVVGNLVDAVAQVEVVDEDVQRHLPDRPLLELVETQP